MHSAASVAPTDTGTHGDTGEYKLWKLPAPENVMKGNPLGIKNPGIANGFGVDPKPEIMPTPKIADRKSPDTISVTVVVPAYNEGRNVVKCLDSILTNEYDRGNIEILIVDGNSEDDTREVVKGWIDGLRKSPYSGFSARLLANPKRTAATGMNAGFRAASGDVVIPFSAHAYMDRDFVEKSIQCLEDTDSDVCGGIVISAPDSPSWLSRSIGCALNTRFALGGITARCGNKMKPMDNPSFGAYRREIFQRHGYMSEDLVRNTDYEFNMRLKRAGEKITFFPDIKSYYYNRSSISALFRQYFYTSYYKAYMIGKFQSAIKPRHMAPPLFFLSLFLLLGLSFIHPVFMIAATALFGVYALTSIAFSLFHPKYFFALPLIYFTIHAGYATGFLTGLLNFAILHRNPTPTSNG